MLTTIITHQTGICLQSADPYRYDLRLGETWEGYLVDWLTSQGFQASRMGQQFIHRDSRKWDREEGKCRMQRKPYKGRLVSEGFLPDLLRPFQIDLRLKVNKTRQYNLEVKALDPRAFQAKWVHIGQVGKYKDKRLPVHKVVLIDQGTGEAWACPNPTSWVVRPSLRGDGYDFAVPRRSLSTLEAWLVFFQWFLQGA